MTLKYWLLASALLTLCPTVGSAQQTPPTMVNRVPDIKWTWRDAFRERNIPSNTLGDKLQIRLETQPDGSQVAIVTNVSQGLMFYDGYGSTTPRFYVEEMKNGQWVPTWWDDCGTGLGVQLLLPGAPQALRLPAPTPGRRTRFWVLFSNTRQLYVPKLSSTYDLNLSSAKDHRESLMLLNPEGS